MVSFKQDPKMNRDALEDVDVEVRCEAVVLAVLQFGS
jgi:hypothetical protein